MLISEGSMPSIWRLVSKKEQTIVKLNSGSVGIPLYFVHSIGGDLHGYDKLVDALSTRRPIFGLQVPKSMMVASAATSIEDMASRYANALMNFQPTGPLVIAGYSAGAVIALELAQQLRLKGREVPLLVAFDGAPNNTAGGLKPWEIGYCWRLLCNIPWRLASIRARDFRLQNLRTRLVFRRSLKQGNLSSPHRTMELSAVGKVVDRGGWPDEQRLFIEKMYRAMVSYRPCAYSGHVILYEVKAQPFLQLLQFGAVWRLLSPACEVVRVNARHSDFFESRSGVRCLAIHLNESLQKIEPRRDDLISVQCSAPSDGLLDQSISYRKGSGTLQKVMRA